METRSHTPVRPSRAERARTVLAAAASVSVHWQTGRGTGGRVDLLGCHHDDPLGDVVLMLEPNSMLVRAAVESPEGDLPVEIELTDLCPVATNERVRARLLLRGRLWPRHSLPGQATQPHHPARSLHVEVGEVVLTELGSMETGGEPSLVELAAYRRAEADPLHLAAAEQLQHLMAHHPEAIGLLARLCDPAVLQGATRVLPVALDRFGLVLRIERLRGHVDVRLAFSRPVETGSEATEEVRRLILEAHRRRPCLRPNRPQPPAS